MEAQSMPPNTPSLQLFSPGFYENPYPTYDILRSTDPVHWDDRINAWVLTRYADVAAALQDERLARGRTPTKEADFIQQLSANGQGDLIPLHRLISMMMLFTDPPKHTRLRALANKAFTPQVVEGMRPHIQTVVDTLLDAMQSAGEMDVIHDFAYPLPVIIITEMLSLPPQERAQFKQWSDDIITFSASFPPTPEQTRQALQSTLDLSEYFRMVVAHLRRNPRDDLMSALVAAEERGDQLSEEELLATAVLLLMNGHETTTNMIGNGLLALLGQPDQLQKLKDDPSLISLAVEEFLRYDGSVQLRGVHATEDIEIGGKQIRQGQTVLMVIGAANRDPAQFSAPAQLDIGRRENRHLDFGRGIHFCIGAALARAELQIAINTMLRRMPHLQLGTAQLEWQTVPVFRGLKALPVKY